MKLSLRIHLFLLLALVFSEQAVSENRFTRSGSAVTDNTTSLEWRVGPDEDVSWASAQAWVESLGGSWRMPTMSELATLYETGICVRNWALFQNSGSFVWSRESDRSSAYYFSFEAGGEYTGLKGMRLYFRAFAVR